MLRWWVRRGTKVRVLSLPPPYWEARTELKRRGSNVGTGIFQKLGLKTAQKLEDLIRMYEKAMRSGGEVVSVHGDRDIRVLIEGESRALTFTQDNLTLSIPSEEFRLGKVPLVANFDLEMDTGNPSFKKITVREGTRVLYLGMTRSGYFRFGLAGDNRYTLRTPDSDSVRLGRQ